MAPAQTPQQKEAIHIWKEPSIYLELKVNTKNNKTEVQTTVGIYNVRKKYSNLIQSAKKSLYIFKCKI